MTLALTSIVPAAWGTGVRGDSPVTHFVNGVAYPDNARATIANHEFSLHVAGRAISQLSINLPEGINVTDGIEVTDKSGKKIDATVSVNNQKAIIAFAQTVPSETLLLISLKGVIASNFQRGLPLFYAVSTKDVGLTAEIPLGSAQIRTYD